MLNNDNNILNMNRRKEKENAIKEVWYRNGNIIYLGETGNEETKFRKNLIFSKKKKKNMPAADICRPCKIWSWLKTLTSHPALNFARNIT